VVSTTTGAGVGDDCVEDADEVSLVSEIGTWETEVEGDGMTAMAVVILWAITQPTIRSRCGSVSCGSRRI